MLSDSFSYQSAEVKSKNSLAQQDYINYMAVLCTVGWTTCLRVLCINCTFSVQYLGCIPGVADWQSPESRSDFLEMVDEGQVQSDVMCTMQILLRMSHVQRKGNIMWYSAVPKLLFISPLWVNIADNKKKVHKVLWSCVYCGISSFSAVQPKV